jgi:glycosyltransferase involved in cell wall biosynthesis
MVAPGAGRAELMADRKAAWRDVAEHPAAAGPMRLWRWLAVRFPWIARQVRRSLRVLWWTARGRLPELLRMRQLAGEGFPSHLLKGLPSSPPLAYGRLTSPPDASGDPAGMGLDPVASPADGDRWDDAPLVSVIVTSFNYGRYLEAAVDSVLRQTLRNLEVIVVEGGSTDPASRAVAAGLRRPRTRVLMQETAQKVGANRNFGIGEARGRYICCLDADDELAPTYLEKAVFLLERHGYDVVSSALELVGGEFGQVDILERPDLGILLKGNHVLTCAVFRRSMWIAAGGFRDLSDKATGHVHEDWAFWIRLAALGARFRNLPWDPMLRYRVHPESLSRGADVLAPPEQRRRVREANEDVLQVAVRAIARSSALAALRYGTPTAPPARIVLDRGAPPEPPAPSLLLAVPWLVLGGAERLLSAIVGDLTARGWRIVIVTTLRPSSEQGDTTSWFEPHTDEIFHLPRGLPPETWRDFIRHLVASRGIGLLWMAGSAVAYDSLRELRAAHPALRVVDLLFNTIGHTANNRRRRDLIDITFVENREVLDWLVAQGEAGERIRLIGSGVDLATLSPAPRDEALTRRIGASGHDLIVGFAGRWSEEKNPLGFIEMARQVDPRKPVKFVMLGRGPQQPEVEAAIQRAGFAKGRFHLLHEVAELAPIMASLDLLVLPSKVDGRPLAVMEALAMGVPVLASRVGGLPELVEPGRTGWLHDPQDIQGFVRTIEAAEADRAGLAAMRREARSYAEAHLDVARMLDGYRREFTRLLPEAG